MNFLKLNIKMKSLIITLFFLIASSNLKAQSGDVDSFNVPEKNLKIGAELVSYRYAEPGLISHSGFLYGVYGEGFWNPSVNVKGILAIDLIVGVLNYDGALCEVKTNVCTDYKAKTNDLIFRMTHRFEYSVSERFNIFAGPGIRYLIDKGDEPAFYTRLGTYIFAPIGFNFSVPTADDTLFLDLEYDLFLVGTMQSRLSEVNSTYSDITHTQKEGSGHKITIGYQQNKTHANPITASLFFESWTIGASNLERLYVNGQPSTTAFVEPKNFSESFGVKVAVAF
jgi:hypothetical protein